jgi:hypothetical protein
LRLLLSGQIPYAEESDLTVHLDHCESCRLMLDELSGADPDLLAAASSDRTRFTEEASLRRVIQVLSRDPELSTIHPTPDSPSYRPPLLSPEETPARLGGCEIARLIGQGGMGLVYQAYDPALKRWVAIKILSPHLASDPVARLRFAREAQAAAAVCHENVITIHAVSELNGLPYIVMDYMPGGSLQDYLDRYGRPRWQEAARLGAEIASGLAAAHSRGLVHRDIKPSNVLLQASETRRLPGAAKIGDFGLARVADDSRLTRTGTIAGTPMYMSPEQSLGEPLDHRADLFSLGSVLYSLCTGREPFPGGTPVVVLRQVCEWTPTSIRRLNPAVPQWLAAVVERLHAKDPAHRVASAAEVAELLRHNLENPESPRILPPGRASGRRIKNRNRALAGTALLCLLVPAALMLAGSAPHAPANAGDGIADERADKVPLRAALRGHNGPVWAISFSPDGQMLATGGDDATLRLWEAASGKDSAVLTGSHSVVFTAAFSHSGEFLVSGSGDGSIRLWDVASRKERESLPHGTVSVRRVAISPDDKTIAVGGTTQDVELWDVETRSLRRALPGHRGTILAIAFATDGKMLATGDARGDIRFWDPATGAERGNFSGDPLALRALAFSPDRATLASAGSGDKDVKLWRVATRERFATLHENLSGLLCLAFSPNGSMLAAGNREGVVAIRDVPSGRTRATLQAHQGAVYALAFSRDGRTLASAGEDRLGKLWDLRGLIESRP